MVYHVQYCKKQYVLKNYNDYKNSLDFMSIGLIKHKTNDQANLNMGK